MFRKLCLIVALSTPLLAQTNDKQLADTKRELENSKIELAYAQMQLAVSQLSQQMNTQLQPMRDALTKAITDAKVSQHLPDTYQYDFATHSFVPPAPVKAAPTVQMPPIGKEAAPQKSDQNSKAVAPNKKP